jgi:hypothetical protein
MVEIIALPGRSYSEPIVNEQGIPNPRKDNMEESYLVAEVVQAWFGVREEMADFHL